VASLLLGVAVCVLWMRSVWRSDQIWYVPPGGRPMLMAASQAGLVGFGHLAPHASQGIHVKSHPAQQPPRWFMFTMRTDGVWNVVFPHWVLIAASAPLPIHWLLHRRRRRKRRTEHACLSCGYDLRATPDRCPECGNAGVSETASGAG
jgi:hypothetical protein